jgi:hypothetical protein
MNTTCPVCVHVLVVASQAQGQVLEVAVGTGLNLPVSSQCMEQDTSIKLVACRLAMGCLISRLTWFCKSSPPPTAVSALLHAAHP